MTLKHFRSAAVVASAILLLGSGLANPTWAQQARRPSPVLAPVEDRPQLPRVLLIGDSISMGYTLPVRELLRDVANVHRIPMNGGPTTNGLAHLDEWLGDRPWDVIHFNWGLHDLKFIDEAGKLVPPAEGKVQVPLDQYAANLAQLVERLRQTHAQLIWCTTTPVPEGAAGRIAGDEVKYNEAAARIMAERQVQVDDLCTFARERLADIQRPANVHFSPEGSEQLATQVAASIRAALTRLPRENLLVYRGSDGQPTPVASPADWLRRRAEILDGMQRIMGDLPTRDERACELDVKIEEEVDCGSYVRRLITYASEPGSRVPAYLLVPKDLLPDAAPRKQQKAPAILCLHGTDNVVGHGVVVGIGNKPNRQYANELAERGYVVLAPNYPLLAAYQPDVQALNWRSGTLKAVWDNIRGLDLLSELPYVDAERFGAIGHSLGGHNAVYTAVFDPRLKVIVSSCGLDSYLDYYGGDEKVWQPEKGWCQTRYMLRLAEYRGRLEEIPFDFHELIGALAPRQVLLVAPKEDHNFQAASVDRIAAAARPIFELYQQPDNLRVEHPDGGHDFPPAMREAAYALFDRALR